MFLKKNLLQDSKQTFLIKKFFKQLNKNKKKFFFCDGRNNNLKKECEAVEDFIIRHDGIDVSIVGLGMNGHVGMNEPGTSPALHSHVAEIDSVTQQVGQKYFKEKMQLTKGITLGIANLMEAGHVILLVSGSKKAAIVKRIL